ncbi:MAG: DUF429 domain-containing protein [Thermoplasmata archaeon]
MYVGVDIGGREGDNTKLAILHNGDSRPTVAAIHDVPPKGDDFIVNFLVEKKDSLDVVGIDSPFELPPCIRCGKTPCPGATNCTSSEARMIMDSEGNPYAERLTEMHVTRALKEVRPMQTMALGQILARTMYLLKRLRSEEFPVERVKEVYPKASLFAFKRALELSAEFDHAVRRYKTKYEGLAARAFIVDALSPLMNFSSFGEECVENHDKLDSTISGLSAYYSAKGLTIPKPQSMPEDAGWIEIPDWTRILAPFKAVEFRKG